MDRQRQPAICVLLFYCFIISNLCIAVYLEMLSSFLQPIDSAGEIAAAHFVDALTWIIFAGRLFTLPARLVDCTLNGRGMIFIALSGAEICPYLTRIANHLGQGQISAGWPNSLRNVTLSDVFHKL